MPLGLGKKGEEQQQPFITNITDKQDLEEVNKISHMLNPNEEVFVVARHYRLKPGGSILINTKREDDTKYWPNKGSFGICCIDINPV
jgi:hypothetical protein